MDERIATEERRSRIRRAEDSLRPATVVQRVERIESALRDMRYISALPILAVCVLIFMVGILAIKL